MKEESGMRACILGLAAMFATLCGASVGAAVAQSGPSSVFPAAPTIPGLWSPKDGDRLEFDVFRNGDPFGRHTVMFRRQGDRLTATTDIDLKVAVGPVTLYHYIHKAEETWIGGQLTAISARTKNRGRWNEVAATAVDGGLQVAGKAFKGVLNGDIIPSSHWNKRQMFQPSMLSTETGEMLPMTVVDKGVETIKVGMRTIEARRYLVKSDIEASFWYDASGHWVKCAFEAEGSKVEYVLRSLPT
jgi:hypothetical protein